MTRAVLVLSLLLVSWSMALGAGWKQKEIIATFWSPPPATDEALARVAAESFTLTWTDEAGLDVAARHGLKAMLQSDLLSPSTLDDPGKLAKLDALISRVKRHRALEAYYICDEPGAWAFPGLGKLVGYLKDRDPAHFAYINLYPTYCTNEGLGTTGDTVTAYKEHLRRYVAEVKPDLISYDHYHFSANGDGDQYFLNLSLIREYARKAGVPFLNIIQACNFQHWWRMPTPAEERWLVYTTLAYGGRGISYFVYWGPELFEGLYRDGKPHPLISDVAKLNREMKALSPVLLRFDSLGVYHTGSLLKGAEAMPKDSVVKVTGGDFVVGQFGKDSKVLVFMIVNLNYRAESTATVRITEKARIDEFDRVTRKWVRYADGGAGFSVPLAAGDGRTFRIVRR